MVQGLATASRAEPEPQSREFARLTPVPDEIVARAFEEWQERGSYLPTEVVSEPAWGILLELLLAEIQGRQASLSRLRKVSAVPAGTADRWLKALERHGLVVRRTGALRPEDEVVSLSRSGSSALRRYFHEVVQSRRASNAPGW
jgi:DNA-binding MarR family transcriptional regulator